MLLTLAKHWQPLLIQWLFGQWMLCRSDIGMQPVAAISINQLDCSMELCARSLTESKLLADCVQILVKGIPDESHQLRESLMSHITKH